MKSLIQHAGAIYTKVADEPTPLKTFAITIEGITAIVRAPTPANAKQQLHKFLNASTYFEVGKGHGVTRIAPGYAKQINNILGMGPAMQEDPKCEHEHQGTNDQMEPVCKDCGEVLGR